MVNYLLSDMLIRITNGYNSNKIYVYIKYSNFCIKVLYMLYIHGFINSYYIYKGNIVIKLKYYRNDHIFKNLKLISKPGKRIYCSVSEIKQRFYYKPFVLISTNLGIITHKDAILKNCGGEILFSLSYS